MSARSFGLGVFLGIVVVAPLYVGAVSIRARALSSWHGSLARVAEAVIVIASLTMITQVLGVIGFLARWPVVWGSIIVGAAGYLVGHANVRDALRDTRSATKLPAISGVEVIVAIGATALVSAQWLAQSIHGVRTGMRQSVDTLWYHLPMAARFAREGSILHVHHFDYNPVTSSYPGGTSLLHATGILLFGNDALSPLLNLIFFAIAITAAWSIGKSVGAPSIALLGTVAVLGMPMLVGDPRFGQPGGAYNDVVGLACVLASIALLIASDLRGFPLFLAAIAAGLALGTKLSMLGAVGGLTIAVFVLAFQRRHFSIAMLWVVGTALTGGYWYVRNAAATRSPLPGVHLPLGPLAPPSLPAPPTDYVAHYLTNGKVLHGILAPGLSQTLGRGWIAVLFLVLAGGVLTLVRGSTPTVRALGAVSLFALVAYIFTPTFIGTPPILFSTTVRFAVVPLALGMTLLSAVPMLQQQWLRTISVLVLAGVLCFTQFSDLDPWVTAGRPAAVRGTQAIAGAGADVVAAWIVVGALAVLAIVITRFGVSSRVAFTVLVLTCTCLASGWWSVQRGYIERRSHASFGGFRTLPVVDALRRQRGVRIATQGLFLQYPMYGDDLSNYVQFLGRQKRNGSLVPLTTCRSWKHAINSDRYDYVLVAADHYPVAPLRRPNALAWAATEVGRGLRPLAREDEVAASFQVVRPLDERTCP
jgi:hypothetical protein